MFRLSKKAEYGLMAMKYIALSGNGNSVTAKEISEYQDIPYELLAKVLQRLTRSNILVSHQGVKGGYSLGKNPSNISLNEIVRSIETDNFLTECMQPVETDECSHKDNCHIRDPLLKIQQKIDDIFDNTYLSNIL